jgi:hypothetical protein
LLKKQQQQSINQSSNSNQQSSNSSELGVNAAYFVLGHAFALLIKKTGVEVRLLPVAI